MKSIIVALFTIMLVTSCTNESSNQEENFFNLREGNLWVYKRYHTNDNANYTYSNIIDSVRAVGDTTINNLTYAKIIHKEYFSGSFNLQKKVFLRVDSNGHLVNEDNLVLHPGEDMNYLDSRTVFGQNNESFGTMNLQLQEPLNVSVEGISYYVYPYYGNFTSNNPVISNNYIFYQYKKGVGLISQHCPSVFGSFVVEDRLTSYELN